MTPEEWARLMPEHKGQINGTLHCESCAKVEWSTIYVFDGEMLVFCIDCSKAYRRECIRLKYPKTAEQRIDAMEAMSKVFSLATSDILSIPQEIETEA